MRSFSTFVRHLAAAGLLAGASLGLVPHLAAQALVPDPFYEAPDDGVTQPQQATYAARKVHTVLVKGQTIATERRGHPLLSWPTEYRVYDQQGRLTSEYRLGYGNDVLSERTDRTYTPTGEVKTSAEFRRVPNPADTTLLGRAWVPASFTWEPLGTAPGRVAYRQEDTGDWELMETYHRWVSHDTTYAVSRSPMRGLDMVQRSYAVAGEPGLWRHDQVRYTGAPRPVQATYSYVRRNAQQQVLEVGRVAFGEVPERQPAEDLARRTTGRLLPRYSYEYDAQGRLRQRSTSPGAYETFVYDAQGRCTEVQWQHRTQPVRQLTRHAYLPNGLLQQTSFLNERGELRQGLAYEYTYYP